MLKHFHTGTGKLAIQEVFKSKVVQAEELPTMEEVNSVIAYHRDQIDGLLDDVEVVTADVFGEVDIMARVVNGKRVNVGVSRQQIFSVFFFFFASFKRQTAAVCLSIRRSRNCGGG